MCLYMRTISKDMRLLKDFLFMYYGISPIKKPFSIFGFAANILCMKICLCVCVRELRVKKISDDFCSFTKAPYREKTEAH